MRALRGFSLLEVLFAVTLFVAVVTFTLSGQAGLIAGNKGAANMSQAMELGRCRMPELEEKQLRLGFPEIEEKDSNPICCGDKEVAGLSCEWRVERVTLPEVTTLGGDAGLTSLLNLGGSSGSGLPASLPGSIGSAIVHPGGRAQLDFDGGLQNLAQTLHGNYRAGGGASAQGLLSMVFSIVYPSLKPVLESAIRRVTVVVHSKEGPVERDFTLTQYLTNPSRAGLLACMLDAGAFGDGGGAPSPGIGTQGKR